MNTFGREKELPIGIEDFKVLIDNNYYFVDKTLFLRDLMHRFGRVSLFTRPRRFGKTLNMSMIRYFFEQSAEDNSYLFQGLKIAEAGEEYMAHQGQYPVISITLKDVEQPDYRSSFAVFKNLVASEVWRHNQLLTSDKVMPLYRSKLQAVCDGNADDTTVITALKTLSDALFQHYRKKVIILIDEYDVPLQNANFNHFYKDMVKLIRSVFSSAVKTNTSMAFAVLTGCLRVSKESIFTGFNNPDVYSVIEPKFADAFGFTEQEVQQMTQDYQLADRFGEIKEWYDGYLFGGTEIYNPWSVLKYMQQATDGAAFAAMPYWVNTSSNSIIQELMMKSGTATRKEIEQLMNGEVLRKPLFNDITYTNLDVNKEHIWSFLLFTGYLKAVEMEQTDTDEYYFYAKIPNIEVRSIYKSTFLQWFRNMVRETDKTAFWDAVLNGDAQVFEQQMNVLLMKSISYHDGLESFYHGFLTGLLEFSDRYLVESNRENGTGRSDIIITDELSKEVAVVIEAKSMGTDDLEAECRDALKQIEDKKYGFNLETKGYKKIIKYGIAFSGKNCRVLMG